MHQFITQFLGACKDASHDEIYEQFEHNCSEELRDEIYDLVSPEANEPFRAACRMLGEMYDVKSLRTY